MATATKRPAKDEPEVEAEAVVEEEAVEEEAPKPECWQHPGIEATNLVTQRGVMVYACDNCRE